MLKCKERHSNIGDLAAIVRAERDKTNYCTFGWLCVSRGRRDIKTTPFVSVVLSYIIAVVMSSASARLFCVSLSLKLYTFK